ncbi:hypothetical protein BH09PLA1_BH09PLA1_05630 [soil metagenome]
MILFACLWPGAAARAEVRYTITDMGDLGRAVTLPQGLSENEMVAGTGWTEDGWNKAFYWSPAGGMIDIIPPGSPGMQPTAYGFGVNDNGMVAGFVAPDQSKYVPHAFVWTAPAEFQQIGTLGGPDSQARGINNAGEVVGYAALPNGTAHAFLWSQGTGIRDIATLGGDSSAAAINEQRQIVGHTVVAGQSRAFRWSEQTGMVDIGTLGGIAAEAFAINNRGHVAGYAATAEGNGNLHSHAFLFDETGMHDLGTLGGTSSQAFGINDASWVVGYASDGQDPLARAFVYDGSTMQDLNDLINPASGWQLRAAYDINNAGQIIAIGRMPGSGETHALLLTPIPEPAGAALLLAVPLGVRVRRRSRRASAR